jgi:hypothetical protein
MMTREQWRYRASACLWTVRQYKRELRAACREQMADPASGASVTMADRAFMAGMMAGRAQAYKEIQEEMGS